MNSPSHPDPLHLCYTDMGLSDIRPETTLWRYMDLAKFVSMLDGKALHFSALAALDDKLEGAAPRVPQSESRPAKWDAWSQWCFNRCVTFVNCWCMSHESGAMWAIYGNQGLAIQTTYALLVEAIDQGLRTDFLGPDQRVYGGQVIYVNPEEEASPEWVWNAISVALKKRWWYKYEEEFRLIYELGSNYPREPTDPWVPRSPKRTSVKVAFSAKKAISSIVVAPHSDVVLEAAVRAICGKFGLNPSIVKRSQIEEEAPKPPVRA